jgi:hypothetical protein
MNKPTPLQIEMMEEIAHVKKIAGMADFILGSLMGFAVGAVYLASSLQQFNDLLDSCNAVVLKNLR